jgi:hypothetical protein
VRTLADEALEHGNRALLDRTAVALLETETLNEPDIEKLKLTIVRDGPGSAIPPRADATEHSSTAVVS